MVETADVKSTINLYVDGEFIYPAIDPTIYNDAVTTFYSTITILAGAVNQVIAVGQKGTIKELKIFSDYSDGNYLSCKINGQSTSWVINPVQIFTQNITALTISNSDEDNDRIVDIEIISIP